MSQVKDGLNSSADGNSGFQNTPVNGQRDARRQRAGGARRPLDHSVQSAQGPHQAGHPSQPRGGCSRYRGATIQLRLGWALGDGGRRGEGRGGAAAAVAAA